MKRLAPVQQHNASLRYNHSTFAAGRIIKHIDATH
jgi:hypothetical protein